MRQRETRAPENGGHQDGFEPDHGKKIHICGNLLAQDFGELIPFTEISDVQLMAQV